MLIIIDMTDLETKVKQLKHQRDFNLSEIKTKLPKYDSKMMDKIRQRDMLKKIEEKRRVEDRK